jgi:hypothetical protein
MIGKNIRFPDALLLTIIFLRWALMSNLGD